MFAKLRERRHAPGTTPERPDSRPRRGSNATTRTTASRSNIFTYLSSTASASSSQLETPSTPTTSDFFPSRPSLSHSFQSSSKQSSQFVRPKTSDGLGISSNLAREEGVSSLPPILPPIPSVATRYSKFLSLGTDSVFGDAADTQKSVDLKDTTLPDTQTHGTQSLSNLFSSNTQLATSNRGKEVPVQNSSMDPAFFSRAPIESRMEATMFPASDVALTDTSHDKTSGAPVSGRAFVDSRDKSYYPPSSNPIPRPLPTPSNRRLPPLRSQTEASLTKGGSALLSPGQEDGRNSAVSALLSSSAISLRPDTSDDGQRSPALSKRNSPVRPVFPSPEPRKSPNNTSSNMNLGVLDTPHPQRKTQNRTTHIPAPDLRTHPAFQTQPRTSSNSHVPGLPRSPPVNNLQAMARPGMRQDTALAPALQGAGKQDTSPTQSTTQKNPLSVSTANNQSHVLPAIAAQTPNSNLVPPPRPPTLRTSSSDPSIDPASSSINDSKSSVRSLRTSSKSRKPIAEPSPVVTIGTPYQDTSATFPLPKHISTRPKDAADTANVDGVNIPTHVSRSGWSSTADPAQPPVKRKTGFLKSMGFLGRKKSNQEAELAHKTSIEERSASEEAFAKQKTVAVVGVNELPANFDPRIRGKGVHDFSSPRRGTRTFSQDSDLLSSAISSQQPSSQSAHLNEAGPRRSVHSPVFREHLAEAPSDEQRAISLNAERLENKAFVQRASVNGLTSANASSHLSFSRQSHQLDPAQAGHALEQAHKSTNITPNDEESGRSGPSANTHKVSTSDEDRKSYTTSTTYGELSPGAPLSGLGIGHLSEDSIYGMPQPTKGYNYEDAFPPGTDQSQIASKENCEQPSDLVTPPRQSPSYGQSAINSLEAVHGSTKDANAWSRRVSSLPTPAQTPEKPSDEPHLSPAPAEDQTATGQYLSGAGFSKQSSNLQHRVSNASRFSFQLGGSAEEEEALEEKHRRNSTRPDGFTMNNHQLLKDEEDDVDEDDSDFDEDAMNDMDEMELQNEHDQETLSSDGNGHSFRGVSSPMNTNSISPFLGHGQFIAQHARVRSDASILTVNTNVVMRTPMTTTFSASAYGRPSDTLEPTIRATSNLRTEIDGHDAPASVSPPSFTLQKPPIPRRTSDKTVTTPKQGLGDVLSDNATREHKAKKGGMINDTHFGSASAPLLQPTGFNFGDFKDFRFADEPDSDMPSQQPFNPHLLMASPLAPSPGSEIRQSGASSAQSSRSSPSPVSSRDESAPYFGRIGQGIRARNAGAPTSLQYANQDEDDSHDDIYFDDGRFEQDIQHQTSENDVMDEERFDDSNFLDSLNKQHREHIDEISMHEAANETSDLISANTALFPKPDSMKYAQRPIPGGAMPLLLTNLPLTEVMLGSQNSLNAYHAALADAAHQAASQGRFQRQSLGSLAETGLASDGFGNATDKLELPPSSGTSAVEGSSPEAGAQPAILQLPRFSNLDFDFGLPAGELVDSLDDDYGADDEIIAAANAEALALDNDGFYGQEFGFYAKARPDSDDIEAINGGFFGDDGDDGLIRNRSVKEPNLTPITERSEFSTRNSFINTNHAIFSGPAGAGLPGPASPAFGRWPISTLPEHEITTFDDLRRWRASAFGGSNDGSLHSSDGRGKAPRPGSAHSPTLSTRSATHVTTNIGGLPMSHTYSNESSSAGSNDWANNPRHQQYQVPLTNTNESPLLHPAPGEYGEDLDVTPRKPSTSPTTPNTARKVAGSSHSRNGSDSITYIHEPGDLQQPPRWVLERRRTGEHGNAELIEREIVPSGWI